MKTVPTRGSRRHPKEERVGRASCLPPLRETQRDHLTLQFESLPHHTKGESDSCVKTLDDSLFGGLSCQTQFQGFVWNIKQNLAFGAGKRRIVFILFVALTEAGKEMKFLPGLPWRGGHLLQGQTPGSREAHKNPVCPLHCGVWKGGGWDRPRLTGGRSLS